MKEASMEWLSGSPFETQNIGGVLAGFTTRGDCITLKGDLGMGKTTLARGFIQSLVPGIGTVNSPSFQLVNTYISTLPDGSRCPLWHVDLYRLKDASELPALGLDDVLGDAIVLIEWPELAANMLPKETTTVEIIATDAVDTRTIIAQGALASRIEI